MFFAIWELGAREYAQNTPTGSVSIFSYRQNSELIFYFRHFFDKNIGKTSMALNLIMSGHNSHALNLIMLDSNSHTACREGIDGVESDNVG